MEFYALYLIPLMALALDTIVGDPRSAYHPVVLIGKVISFYESIFYHNSDKNIKKLIYGGITVFFVLFTVWFVAIALLMIANRINFWIGYIINVLFVYISISPRSLAEAGMELYRLLRKGDLIEARRKVGWIVGRDTADLDEGEITRATVETISENTVDGILSPLFFCFVFGPIGALLYRTANTMDSMLGYKNERYLYFGRVAARFDDFLNYIPARLGFILLTLSAAVQGFDWREAINITLRDAHKHPSPNGGYAEAPTAGALHIRLGGYNKYGNEVHFRAYMGNPEQALQGRHIKQTIRLMYGATIITVLLLIFRVFFH